MLQPGQGAISPWPKLRQRFGALVRDVYAEAVCEGGRVGQGAEEGLGLLEAVETKRLLIEAGEEGEGERGDVTLIESDGARERFDLLGRMKIVVVPVQLRRT